MSVAAYRAAVARVAAWKNAVAKRRKVRRVALMRAVVFNGQASVEERLEHALRLTREVSEVLIPLVPDQLLSEDFEFDGLGAAIDFSNAAGEQIAQELEWLGSEVPPVEDLDPEAWPIAASAEVVRLAKGGEEPVRVRVGRPRTTQPDGRPNETVILPALRVDQPRRGEDG